MSTASDVLDLLRQRGWTLGVAESLTGGALTAELVSVPGASSVLLGGIVAYATPVKHTLLRVDGALLTEHGPVHPEVARQMAAGVRDAVAVDSRSADVGVSTTGVAGPTAADGRPVGTVHIGIVTPVCAIARSFLFAGDRAEVRHRTVEEALAELLTVLRE